MTINSVNNKPLKDFFSDVMNVNGFIRFVNAHSTMLSKNDIKFIRSLGQSKQRKKQACFIAEGSKVINEFLNEGMSFKKIFTLDSSKIIAKEHVFEIVEKELKQISFQNNPQDSLAIFEIPNLEEEYSLKLVDFILVCDKIQDPGNLGTIIRIADWFGIKQMVCSKDTADVYNPKVVQSTMGSLSRVNVTYRDLIPFLSEAGGQIKIISTSLDGENLFKMPLPKEGIIILGNESQGVRRDIQKLSDLKVKIPSFGGAESLNVAVSAGIICAELRRLN